MRDAQGKSGRRRYHMCMSGNAWARGLTLQLVFHAETLAFDNHRLGVMQQPIQDGRGEGAVIVENLGPLLEGAVRGDDNRPLFIAQRDDLEEEIRSRLVNGEIAEFVQDEQG